MSRLLPILILLGCNFIVLAQKKYFQQETNFQINVTLDDENHVLSGNETIEYINNSPDNLSFIYFHLWLNAYSSKSSAFAQQEVKHGKSRFYFADNKNMGAITDLDFRVDGKKCEVEIDSKHPDIAKVILPEPLQSGKKIIITTPFTAKIPYAFSRGGRIGQQYLMTQWYPKPAVYDVTGWHAMPYLDQGEFYAEFGQFDVSITLPENYVVGATGTLETPNEIAFIRKRPTESISDSVPASSKNMKTIRFKATKIHDFAWFADKAFNVLKSDVVLKNGKKVETYAYFRQKYRASWQKATDYINRAVRFYSDVVGDYPHPHASAVMADDGFNGGMEYPMITVLAGHFSEQDLDITITHEVGHNWFQGILANNEREFAWLDEGINSYYEHRYTHQFYPETDGSSRSLPRFVSKHTDYSLEEIALQYQDFNRKNQPIETTSNHLTPVNYFMNAYEKPARLMKILENQYGLKRFDEIMQTYFAAWQFKHPQPTDFRQHWEQATGDNLSWLFDGLFKTIVPFDYIISDIRDNGSEWVLELENPSHIAVPFDINYLKNGKEVSKQSFKGFDKKQVIGLPKGDFDLIVLDNNHLLPDINRSNNYVRVLDTNKATTKLPWDMKFLGGIGHSGKNRIYGSPIIGVNNYDGLMLGVLLHNGIVPQKSWSSTLIPLWGSTSYKLTGLADLGYKFFTPKKHTITLSASGKRFSYAKKNNKFLAYSRISPSVTIDFWKRPLSQFTQSLSIRHLMLNQQNLLQDTIERISIKSRLSNSTEISYWGSIKNSYAPTTFRVCVENYRYQVFETRQNFLKTTVELTQSYQYRENRHIMARLFVGGFPINSGRNAGFGFTRGFLGLSARGFSDYRYDDFYFGRNEQKGILSQQVSANTEGGLKFALPEGEETRIGYSNNFVSSLNLKAQFPFKLPLDIKPYFDVGFFSDTRPGGERTTSQWLMSGGLSWELNEYLGIYVPLYFSGKKDDPNSFHSIMTRRNGFLSRITFSLNLRKLDLRRLLDNLSSE